MPLPDATQDIFGRDLVTKCRPDQPGKSQLTPAAGQSRIPLPPSGGHVLDSRWQSRVQKTPLPGNTGVSLFFTGIICRYLTESRWRVFWTRDESVTVFLMIFGSC